MKTRFLRDGLIRTLKDTVDPDDYQRRFPNAIRITGDIPDHETLAEWMNDCGCESLDGCWVEPDGHCEHGLPSWLMALGMI
jgi:hypothetical protein